MATSIDSLMVKNETLYSFCSFLFTECCSCFISHSELIFVAKLFLGSFGGTAEAVLSGSGFTENLKISVCEKEAIVTDNTTTMITFDIPAYGYCKLLQRLMQFLLVFTLTKRVFSRLIAYLN